MKKKVLFVINTMGRAGAERCLLHLLKAWEDEEYDISLFSVLGRGELFLEVPPFVRILNESPQAVSVFDQEARKSFAREIMKGMLRRGNFFKNFFSTLRLFLWQVKEKKINRKRLCWKLVSDAAPILEEEFDLAVGYIQGAATYYTLDHVKAKRKVVFLHNEYELSGYCHLVDRSYYEKADRIY
ncbi:MAG: glycosyltransferase, partial [Lachnospiraceae bacterium]|nr:glycosyltransferase [Lachnospiraceae bacterium]